MVSRSLASTRTLFACSLVAFHPELDPRETRRWVTVQNLPEVLLAIDKAWNQSMPEAKAEEGEQGADPPQENGRS